MTQLKCPICKEMLHKDKRWEIEQFITQTKDEITAKMLAERFSISQAQAGKYLNTLVQLELIQKFRRGRQYFFIYTNQR